MATNAKEEVDIQKLYGQEASLSKQDFFKKYSISETGLTQLEAETNLKNLGPNEIKQAKSKKWYHYLFRKFI